MKKIAFALAMLIALTGCLFALASCGDEPATSSEEPAASSEAPATSSEEPAASSEEPAASSEEPAASSEEPVSDEPAESSEEAPVVDPGTDNLAAGKTYTISMLYPNTETANYPDEGGKSLTDGTKIPESAKYSEPCWAGFNISTADYQENGYATITVDLGEKKDVAKYVIYSGSELIGSGIKGIKSLEILVSDDGTNFTSIGTADAVDSTAEPYITVEVLAAASARYVQFRFIGGANWMFISEVEVY